MLADGRAELPDKPVVAEKVEQRQDRVHPKAKTRRTR